MSNLAISLVLGVIFLPAQHGGLQPTIRLEEPSFSLNISTSQSAFRSGSEIKLDITLTNTSSREIVLAKALGPRGEVSGYVVQVQKNGHTITPMNHRERQAANHEDDSIASFGYVPLQPGKTLDEKIIINKLFDLKVPGEYTIQVHRMDEDSKSLVKSNLVILSITP